MGALVQRLVGIREPASPGVQPAEDLTALASVACQREAGEKAQARAGRLQVGLDVGVAASGAQLASPDRLGESGFHCCPAQAGNTAGGNFRRHRVVGGKRAGIAQGLLRRILAGPQLDGRAGPPGHLENGRGDAQLPDGLRQPVVVREHNHLTVGGRLL